jgi:hypothetical protein
MGERPPALCGFAVVASKLARLVAPGLGVGRPRRSRQLRRACGDWWRSGFGSTPALRPGAHDGGGFLGSSEEGARDSVGLVAPAGTRCGGFGEEQTRGSRTRQASSYLTFDFACPSLTRRPMAAAVVGFYSQGRSVPYRTPDISE